MSFAVPQTGTLASHDVPASDVPIHWPSAIAGLVIATTLVVAVSSFAAARRSAQPATRTAQVSAPPTAETQADTSRADPAVQRADASQPAQVSVTEPAPPAPHQGERLRVAQTGGSGANLRSAAGERGPRIKTLGEGAILETVGPDQRINGTVWRNVRDTNGAVGWISGSLVVGAPRAP